jgi:hypothetical protein
MLGWYGLDKIGFRTLDILVYFKSQQQLEMSETKAFFSFLYSETRFQKI